MQVRLAYGDGGLLVEAPDSAYVVESEYVEGVADERGALQEALRRPPFGRSLAESVRGARTAVLVFPDVTRAMPTDRVVPVVLEELAAAGLGPDRVTLLSGTGTHRANTAAELQRMLGATVTDRYRVVNHDARDRRAQAHLGMTSDGAPALLDRMYVEADARIVVGLIEPHFFAGFSGGPKGVCPGVAGLETVLHAHDAERIGDPRATWCTIEGNPIQRLLREVVALAPPTFTLDVTLNKAQQITGVFAGEGYSAHDRGCRFIMRYQQRMAPRLFDVVVTSNGGYPLDQNLYQSVKGLSAAARIVRPGGAIVLAAECRDGIPNHGSYGAILAAAHSTHDIFAALHNGSDTVPDQWEAQVQALVQQKATVYAFCSGLSDEQLRAAHLTPTHSVDDTLAELLRGRPEATVAVLPEGPYLVPTAPAAATAA